MLELLLFTYNEYFGEDFPLAECSELTEIELINVIYDCIQNTKPYESGQRAKINRFPNAPGLKEKNQ